MRYSRSTLIALSAAILLGGCASTPMGPTVQVMPAPNKPWQAFEEDQAICKQYANQQVAGQADSANQQALGGAVLGTVLGAGLGAAVDGGRGAGVGAAAGSLLGTGMGASSSQHSQHSIQHQYDVAYSQCMYSKGNQVPGFQPAVAAPLPPPTGYAPPPQGYAPPPPQGYAPPPPPPGYAPPPPPPGR